MYQETSNKTSTKFYVYFFVCLINAVAPKNKTKKLNAVTLKQRVDIYRKIDHNKKIILRMRRVSFQ